MNNVKLRSARECLHGTKNFKLKKKRNRVKTIFFWTSSDADFRTFGEKKTSDFLKFIVCPHGQEGRRWANSDILRTNGEEANYLRFYADVVYGRPLT